MWDFQSAHALLLEFRGGEKDYFREQLELVKKCFAFNDRQMGCLKATVEKSIKIDTIPHVPRNNKPIPLPKSTKPQVIEVLKGKIDSGVLEPGRSAYENRWFIQDFQQANKVTIKDDGLPPIAHEFSEEFMGRSIYSVFDLYSGYDQIPIDESSRENTIKHSFRPNDNDKTSNGSN
ncbi:hypothetical protein AYI68_g4750 [Smittium mucronatum]|uniref:Uncharacterized protein n=1 Tax=Smittium mucronatum TaxID=133383 RepID=A0A1R0GW86_9FUNG|nr:hypothetical protein AYI68_g4750 [Smittium mucronatum]